MSDEEMTETRERSGSSPEVSLEGEPIADAVRGIDRRIDRAPELGGEERERLQSDLDVLRERLSKLGDDLKASFHICPCLTQRILSPRSFQQYREQLEADEALREKTRGKLVELSRCLGETSAVLEALPRLTAGRSRLDEVEDVEWRRRGRNAVDHCKEIEEELAEWKKSAERGLRKISESGLPDVLELGALLPEDERRAPRKRPRRRGRRERSDRGKPRSEAASPTREDDEAMRRLRSRLDALAARDPFLPARAGTRARVRKIGEKRFRLLRVRALWGERVAAAGAPTPAPEREPRAGEVPSLWSLPARPPGGFREASEPDVPLEGGERVEPCATCSGEGWLSCRVCLGSGRRKCSACAGGRKPVACERCEGGWVPCSCDEGRTACSACAGAGRLLRPLLCRTRYRVESFESRLPAGDPDWPRLEGDLERVWGEELAGDALDPEAPGRRECLERIEERLGPEARAEVEKRWLGLGARGTSGDAEPAAGQRRLMRWWVELRVVVATSFECGLRTGEAPTRAWLTGPDRRLRLDSSPRRFGPRVVGWLLGFLAAGAALGCALGTWLGREGL